MLTEGGVGFRYGYTVTDSNKTASSGEIYTRTSAEARATGLADGRTVQHSDAPNSDKKGESKYNADGTLKSEDRDKKTKSDGTKVSNEEYYKQLITPNKSDDSVTAQTKAFSEKTEHRIGKHDGFDKDCPLCECDTCKNRRYKDGSDDSAVSFQQATKMSPDKAKHMVRSHEMEHVRREQYAAKEEGERVISQSVQIMTDVCPECGETYVSGGLTRTTTKPIMPEFIDLFRVGADDITRKGEKLDQTA